MLLVYNYVLLKISTWYSKHVEECNNIWRINNIQCITLVVLYDQVFHVRKYFLCFPTKCQGTCNSYQVLHVRIFCMLISRVYQHLCELVEWDRLHSLQPLKSASESEKFCGRETNCSFDRISIYAILLFCLLDKVTARHITILLGWDIVPYLNKDCPCPPHEGIQEEQRYSSTHS